MNAKVFGILIISIMLWTFLGIVVGDSFLNPINIENLLRRTALYGILGIGVAFVIISSGIDLSIGSVVCLAGCLLALFVKVDYSPPDRHDVIDVRGESAQVVLDRHTSAFVAGDMVRYYGGRRAATAIRTVRNVEKTMVEQEGKTIPATIVTVDAPFQRNDYTGSLAKVYKVADATDGDDSTAAQISIAGDSIDLVSGDQIVLVHPESGLKQLTIIDSDPGDDTTSFSVTGTVSGVDSAWRAVPLPRRQRMPAILGVTAVLVIGAALGLTHGLLITKAGLQPFVVTLCGLLFYRGISRWLVADEPQGFGTEFDETLRVLATGEWTLIPPSNGAPGFGIPIPFFILLAIAVIAAIFLGRTIWGRYLLALGRNREAAEYSGIDTDRITILAYVLCSMLAALGGMLFALDANSVSPSSFGNFFELYAIAAAVLGGCSLRGGEGSILGVVIGTALMRTLYNMIVLLRISDTLQYAIIGSVILIGVLVDEFLKRWAARRRVNRRV